MTVTSGGVTHDGRVPQGWRSWGRPDVAGAPTFQMPYPISNRLGTLGNRNVLPPGIAAGL